MTLTELAKLAGVSVSTVSKALKNAPDVGATTKEKIWGLAKEYGCYGKYFESRFDKKVIGIILPEFDGNYYVNISGKLEKIINDGGGMVIYAADKFDANKQAELIDYFISLVKVDGLFVFHMRSPLKKGYKNMPIVSFNSVGDVRVDDVKVDVVEAVEKSIKHLYEMGHRRIAFFGEGLTQRKGETFKSTVKKYKNATPYYMESGYRFEAAGEECVDRLLENAPECTAIMCAYDNIAYGAVKRLKERGFRVPDDYSIVGCNNLNFSEYTDLPLSTVDLNDDAVVESLWELMQKKLDNSYFRVYKPAVIHGSFVVKATVAPPRNVCMENV